MTRLPTDPPEGQFERLVREHHAAVYRSAMRVAANSAAAADVAQEVYLRVLRGQARLDTADSERATLCWLAARLAHNAVRARRRRKQHEENVMPSDPRQQDPAEAVVANDLAATVQHCVAGLPADLRMPLELHCQDGLTLASVGSALQLSTSTVHGRVQQALARLRAALGQRGFAIAVVALPDLVKRLPALAAPAGLEAQLLAAGQESALVAVSATRRVILAAGITVGLVGIVVGANAIAGSQSTAVPPATAALEPTEPSVPADGAPVRRDPVGAGSGIEVGVDSLQPAAPAQPALQRMPLSGTVHDAAAWPVVGARVTARAAGGLKSFELGHARTDHRGTFRLDVDFDSLRPSAIRLEVHEDGVRVLSTAEIPIPRPDPKQLIALVLPEEAGVATDRYRWSIAVRDEHGVALDKVQVVSYPAPLTVPGKAPGFREAVATTDSGGLAELRGRKLGSKWLLVDGRELGRGYSFTKFSIDRGGRHQQQVVLPAGGSLAMQASALDGKQLDYCQAWLEDEVNGIRLHSRPLAGGGARFTGMGDGRYTLHVYSGMELSPAMVRGLRAGGQPVTLRLKRRDDERDVGDHMAEIHGSVVDADTGEELQLGSYDVEVLPVRPGASTLPFDRIVPPPAAQRMMSDRKVLGFHEVGLAPGRHAVVVGVAGYAPTAHEFEVRDNELRTGVRIEMHRGGEVHGRVLDQNGAPVAKLYVTLLGIGAGAEARLAAMRALDEREQKGYRLPTYSPTGAFTQSDGSFVMRRVPPGIALRLCASDRRGRIGVADLGVVRSGEVVIDRVICLE